ncbi:MAG TPA: branched-chain amino acid ABC transporter substrate-binding protein [Anaerolineae bacterium]|nr:branched-chain amino acid ABC transporter substrate-binding protein [Anaerolineae bacterium]HQK13976.1 branched-chain amino acid ABC transporter substrate-binding protein [Anaerolineae bacterium]
MMKRLGLTIVLLVTLVLAGCGGSKQPTKGDVIVYVAVPLSGFQANGGQTVLGGVRLAAEEINRSGGLLGYRVVVRPLDDESDSDVAVARVAEIQEALNKGERVIAVIGHLNSGQTLAAMELYKDLPLIVITPTASEQSLSQKGYTNFFRVNASDDVQAAVDARFLTEYLKATRVAVISNNTEYGRGLAASLIKELESQGAQAVTRIEVEEGQSQYQAEVQQIQAAKPDAIFYAGYEIEAPFLRYALVKAGITVPMLGSDGVFLAATIDDSDGTAEGMYVSAFAPSPRYVADAKWFEAYQVVEYRNPDTYSVNGYVAMQVLAEGVRKANSFDASKIADTLRKETVSTLLNSLRYKPNGDLTNPQIWIYQVVNNEFQQVDWK